MGLVNDMAGGNEGVYSLCIKNPPIGLGSIIVTPHLSVTGTDSGGCTVDAEASGEIILVRKPRVRTDLDTSFLVPHEFYFYSQGCCPGGCRGQGHGKGESGQIPLTLLEGGAFSYTSCTNPANNSSGTLSLFGNDQYPTYYYKPFINFSFARESGAAGGDLILSINWMLTWQRSDLDPTIPAGAFGGGTVDQFTLDNCQDLFDDAGFDFGFVSTEFVTADIGGNVKFIKAE